LLSNYLFNKTSSRWGVIVELSVMSVVVYNIFSRRKILKKVDVTVQLRTNIETGRKRGEEEEEEEEENKNHRIGLKHVSVAHFIP